MVALVYLCVPSRQLPSSLREHLGVADSLVLHDTRSKAYGTSRRLLSLKPVLRPCVSCLLAGHCRRSQRRHLRHGGHLYNSVHVHLDKNGTTTRRACCHWSYLHNKSASQLCTDHEHDRTHKRDGMWLHDCHRHHHLQRAKGKRKRYSHIRKSKAITLYLINQLPQLLTLRRGRYCAGPQVMFDISFRGWDIF